MKKIYLLLSFFFVSFMSQAQNPDAFIMTVEVGNNSALGITGLNVTLPIVQDIENNYTVDFGDGTILINQTGSVPYTYSSAGIYTITVTGNFKKIRFANLTSAQQSLRYKLKSIEQWGTTQWESMEGAFSLCKNLVINATDAPDLSQVTDMSAMFSGCQALNQSLNNWDVSNVTNMTGLFHNTSSFNQPIGDWDVSSVTNMKNMFSYSSFNQPIGDWDVSNVTNMEQMFYMNFSFNQPIGNWDVSSVTNMQNMYESSVFNQPIGNWDVSSVTSMHSMFRLSSFNQSIGDWDVSNVTNMEQMFSNSSFNQPIGNWDVSNVTNMGYMFYMNSSFNQPIGDWDVSNVVDMTGMFAGLHNSMNLISSFNQPLGNWNVSNVANMMRMFEGAVSFNQPLNSWDVSNVTNMSRMFYIPFDWNTYTVSPAFNQPLNNWDVSNVTDMTGMFEGARNFNQDLSSWNFNSNVIFETPNHIPGQYSFILFTALDTSNYDALLLRFAQLQLSGKKLRAQGLEYCNVEVHNYLTNELSWTIYSDEIGENCILNIISGYVFFDADNDGCDSGDIYTNNFLVSAYDGSVNYSSTNNDGQYQLNLLEGNYDITLLNVPDYFTVSPQTSNFSFEGYDNEAQLNFCLTANQTIQDLNVIILPLSEARPGFETEYQIVVQNMGTEDLSNVLINLVFDETKQSFVEATLTPISETTNQLSFEVDFFTALSNLIFNLTMETFAPPTVNGGDILNFTATVTPDANDYTPNDNTFALEQIVVNSFDPNDKQVLQGDKIHIDNVGEYLHYLIRFQNTGTASAIHVRIEDELHETLDWNTIQIIGASHNYRAEITEGNQIEFIFENINLPHEDADEAGSNGFIAYKIKAVEGLEIGDFIIGNEAEIYFDFNLPIITNSTSTEVVLPLDPSGMITLDENNNGCDTEDTKSDFFFVQIDSETSNYSFSQNEGTYILDFLEEDTYTVSLKNVPDYFTLTPESYTLAYQGLGDYEALDFCVTANQAVEDVNIVVLPLNQAQIGSTNHYRIIVQNLGTQTVENISLSLEFDPTQQTFVISVPTVSSTSSNQLNFIIASLPILQNTVIDFSMQTFSTPTVNVGDILAFNVWVDSENDTTPNDNAFELKQTVADSSQSNYKQVLQGDKILIEQASDYLHYFISFENTDVSTVTNLKIKEYIHETLDWNTFQLVNTSHDYKVGITQGNQMEFTFKNINLAPSETGFIAYRIKPVEGLQVGDMIIGNEAEVYFDGSLSSVTNAADTEIVNPTVGIASALKDMLWIYPNPTSDVLNIQTKGNIQLEEVQLYNLQGRVLITSKQNLQSINVGNLSSGVYLLNIKTSEGNLSQRVIKK
jgi:surface protein